MGQYVIQASYTVQIRFNYAEILARGGGGTKTCGNYIKNRLVLNYDLWMVMVVLKEKDKNKCIME